MPTMADGRPEEKHGVPALLSFFIPGLGQIVKGQVGRAFAIWLGLATTVLAFFFIGAQPGGSAGGVLLYLGAGGLALFLWLWQIYDAYAGTYMERAKARIEQKIRASASSIPGGNLDHLEKLADLAKRGVISQEEFHAKKKQILGI